MHFLHGTILLIKSFNVDNVLTITTQGVIIYLQFEREHTDMANINIRIDDNVKKNAEHVFAELGLTPTSAIVLFYHQVIRTKSIPFELKTETPNETTLRAIAEVEEMEKNPEGVKTYESVDDLLKELKK